MILRNYKNAAFRKKCQSYSKFRFARQSYLKFWMFIIYGQKCHLRSYCMCKISICIINTFIKRFTKIHQNNPFNIMIKKNVAFRQKWETLTSTSQWDDILHFDFKVFESLPIQWNKTQLFQTQTCNIQSSLVQKRLRMSQQSIFKQCYFSDRPGYKRTEAHHVSPL